MGKYSLSAVVLTWFFIILNQCACSLDFMHNIFFETKTDNRYYLDMTKDYFGNKSFFWVYNSTSNQASLGQIPAPVSNLTKFSFSLMFWPYTSPFINTNKPNCTKQLGMNAILPSYLTDHNTELINSMTFFERVRVNVSGNLSNYFQGITTDKTSQQYTLSRSSSGYFEEVWVDSYTCDNVLLIRSDKAYIFCWKTQATVSPSTNETSYRLLIKGRIWSSQSSDQLNTSTLSVSMTQAQFLSFNNNPLSNKMLRTIACKSLNGSSIDIAFYVRNTSIFFIVRLTNDLFKEYIFPTEYQGMTDEKPLQELKSTVNIPIYSIDYIDDYRFLITQMVSNFNEYDSSTYGLMHYLDGALSSQPRLVGQGMIVTYRKGLDSDRSSIVSEVFLIKNSVNTTTVGQNISYPIELTIQVRKYYNGYFYGDHSFKIKISGRPRLFKGFVSKNYILYMDFSETMVLAECTNASSTYTYYNSRVLVSPLDQPNVYRTIMNFDQNISNPLKLLVTPNNNMIYIRYPHKLEVFNLQDIGVNLASSELTLVTGLNTTINTTAETNTLRLLTTETKNISLLQGNLSNVYQGHFVHLRNSDNLQIDYASTNLVGQPYTTGPSVRLQANTTRRQFYYPGPFESFVSGNFLAYSPNLQDGKNSMRTFDPKYMSPPIPSNKKISRLYCIQYKNLRYLLVSYANDQGNDIFKFDPSTRQTSLAQSFYDNRPIISLQKVSYSKYLARIEGLLYELDMDTLELNPVFQSNELCGDVFTTVNHLELGIVTICGGKGELAAFITDYKKGKIDLSTPLNNIRVNPSLYHQIKTDGIYQLVSTHSFTNRFVMLSKPVKILYGLEGIYVVKMRIRLFEVCSSKQYVEIIPEYEQWVYFTDPLDDASAYVVDNKLVLFTHHTLANSVKELVTIYSISASFSLELDKVLNIPDMFRLNVKSNKPQSTYLPTSRSLMSRVFGSKIVMMVSLRVTSRDINSNFDFFDYGLFVQNNRVTDTYVNYLAVLDPSKSSLDCIKFVLLPDDFSPYTYGSYFLVTENPDSFGLVVASEKRTETRIYFLEDHSFFIDFYSYSDFQGYFNQNRQGNLTFAFNSKNLLNSKSRELNFSIDLNPKILSTEMVELNNGNKNFDVNLVDQDGKTKYFDLVVPSTTGGPLSTDLFKGYPFDYSFTYDSWLEHYAGKIDAEFHCKVEQYPQDIVTQISDMISYKPEFTYYENAFTISPLERFHPVGSEDYADLLFSSIYITTPLVEMRSRSREVQPNIHLASNHRCSKVFYQEHYLAETQELVVCLKLSVDSDTGLVDAILVYVYNERPGPSDLYSFLRTETPILNLTVDLIKTPFSDYNIITTLNHFVLRKNTASITTYSYQIYRLQKQSIGFSAVLMFSDDVWMTDFRISNNFFQNSTTGIVSQRFCTISSGQIDTLIFQYYCFEYDPMNMAQFNPTVKILNLFDVFNLEDIQKYPPQMLIFNMKVNPVANQDSLITDPLLYFMFSFQTYLTVFAKLDPTKEPENSGLAYTILCNPFEGFKFDREFHTFSDKYYSKASVYNGKTYLSFYNLPSAYTDLKVNLYTPFYQPQDFSNTSNIKPVCLESKFVKILDFPITSLYPLRFTAKNIPAASSDIAKEPDQAVIRVAMHTNENTYLLYNKKALQMVLRDENNRFYRVEYMPRIEVKTTETLLLSDFVFLDVKGLFNSSISLQINLISGKITQFVFVLNYTLPLLVLIALIIALNFIMAYIFKKIQVQSTAPTLGKIGEMMKADLQKLGDPIKSTDGADSTSDNTTLPQVKPVSNNSLSLPVQTSAQLDGKVQDTDQTPEVFNFKNFRSQKTTVKMEIKIKQDQERELKLKEKADQHRYKREALGIPLVSEDPDFVDELTLADYVRNLYSKGVLKMEMTSAEAEEVNRTLVEEGNRSLVAIMTDKEDKIVVPETIKEEYRIFEEYMDSNGPSAQLNKKGRGSRLFKVPEDKDHSQEEDSDEEKEGLLSGDNKEDRDSSDESDRMRDFSDEESPEPKIAVYAPETGSEKTISVHRDNNSEVINEENGNRQNNGANYGHTGLVKSKTPSDRDQESEEASEDHSNRAPEKINDDNSEGKSAHSSKNGSLSTSKKKPKANFEEESEKESED